jgi:hypothetical protein
MNHNISRRNFLRGAGATMMLPLMESFGAAGAAPPKRILFLNFGYGPSEAWYPKEAGANFALPEAMRPLADLRDSFSVVGNLTNLKSAGTGSHWGATTFLTGADTRRTSGREFHNDISCDQIAAAHLGKDVRFPSLALSQTHSGLAPGYGPGSSLSWDALANSIEGIIDPVDLYSELFGDGGMTIAERKVQIAHKRSVLDAIHSDAKGISRVVGKRDKEKMDEYFTLIRNIEKRIARNEIWMGRPKPKATLDQPSEVAGGTPEIELMFDLALAALRTDSTRVITYRMPTQGLLNEFAKENKNESVPVHPMTHFGSKDSVAYKQLIWRDEKICSLFATLLKKMQAIEEADGSSLLDNTVVAMGSGLHTGHERRNLPVMLAGGGLRHGAHYVYKANEGRLADLWLGILKHSGCPVDSFADSEGPLTEMFG